MENQLEVMQHDMEAWLYSVGTVEEWIPKKSKVYPRAVSRTAQPEPPDFGLLTSRKKRVQSYEGGAHVTLTLEPQPLSAIIPKP